MSESNWMERLEAFRTRNHSLRLGASRVSAMAGFHPFAVLPELLMTLVYQGGQELLEHDARLLGIQIRSEEAILMELANKASKSTATALQSALDVKRGKRVLDTVKVAEQVKMKVLKEAKSSKKLNPDELKVLQEGVRSSIDTGFGTHHEDAALDLFERKCGWEVRERNAAIMAWPFARAEDVNPNEKPTQPSVVPIADARAVRTFSDTASRDSKDKGATENMRIDIYPNDCDSEAMKALSGEEHDVMDKVTAERTASLREDTVGSDTENAPPSTKAHVSEGKGQHNTNQTMMDAGMLEGKADVTDETNERSTLSTMQARPFFTIYGAVDGIRDELWCPPCSDNTGDVSAFDEDWQLRQIIVECKHRMRKTFHSPPLYDQIQTTAYCLMYNVDNADIVQVMRNPKPSAPNKLQKTNETDTVTNRKPESTVASESTDGGLEAEEAPTAFSTETVPKNRITCLMNDNHVDLDMKENADAKLVATDVEEDKKPHATEVEGALPENTAEVPETNEQASKAKDKSNHDPITAVKIDVKRVSIDDPLFQHRQNWNDIILPRLRSFVDAVYSIRANDSKRYRLLVAMSDPSGTSEAWNILHEECPWLKDCDTAFHRDY